ncbi:MAG: glycosyltransferase family 9 protein [Bacteroidales bacterium]|nr:glycosyltransferase family 9 protein [Bacteroidales bacterium]
MRILLSRTDSIGDVILTLPMAGLLKKTFPDCTLIFLGRNYTRPVIELSKYVDQFVSLDDLSSQNPVSNIQKLSNLHADVIIHVFPVKKICHLAKQAGIPVRIATARRYFTWFTCNRLLHVSRKNSNLHEAQLNLKMLQPLGINQEVPLSEIPQFYGFSDIHKTENPATAIPFLVPGKFNLILHPKSKGSAREWGFENFSRLISLLPKDKFNIMVTGTAEEGMLMKDFLAKNQPRILDLTGKFQLLEFISLIRHSNGLVAASTGPLHLAAAFGIMAIGLYSPMRPIFPQRWAPLGKNACFFVLNKKCSDCRKTNDCACIRGIAPEQVAEKLIRVATQ